MQSLLGGADCSSSSNPLKQVAQREAVDRSLFRDRLATRPNGSSSSRPFASGATPPVAAQQHHLVAQAKPFNLGDLSAALNSSSSRTYESPVVTQHDKPVTPPHFQQSWMSNGPTTQTRLRGPTWKQNGPQDSAWADEMASGSMMADRKGKGRATTAAEDYAPDHHPVLQQYQSNLYQQSYRPQIGYQPMLNSGQMYQGTSQQPFEPMRSAEEQKKMEDAFERALQDARAQDQGSKGGEEDVQEIVRDEEEKEFKGDFEAIWESLRPEAERLNKLAEWEKDFSQFVSDEDDLYETLNDSMMRDGLGQASLDEQLDLGPFGPGYQDDLQADNGLPIHRDYVFASPNPFDFETPVEAYCKGMNRIVTGGSLSEASLYLESFLRRATQDDYREVDDNEIDVWNELGKTHAMNEKEDKGLSAFEEGRKILEANSNITAQSLGQLFTSLAISYVNESNDLAALNSLHQYIATQYPTQACAAPTRSSASESGSPWELHERVRDTYLEIAKSQYAQGKQVNPDIQVGLGTLYYMMGEYGDARDCWVAALGERPDDYLLWNRLGATLANGGNSEEAVDAYRRALELRPTFTRAIFNLGVACMNIGVHREAAEHFLAALSLHEKDQQQEGDMEDPSGLWMLLRRALTALDLKYLASQAQPSTDLDLFRRSGFEF